MTESNKICLIIPPSGFLLDERVFISLGILKVASALEQQDKRVDLLDLSGVSNYLDVVKDYCRKDTSVFGITATTPQLPAATLISGAIKGLKSDSKVILGGPHVTLSHASKSPRALKHIENLRNRFDVLVAGDGERAIFQALKTDKGIVNADSADSQFFLTSKDLNDSPLPARHLIDFSSYHYKIDGVEATSLIAQLGCPFECGFCGGRGSPSLRRIRTRTPECIIEEMKQLYETYGVRGFMFYDDELNVNKGLVPLMNKIKELQDSLGVEFRLRGFVKSELFTPEQAESMYGAGFRWILTGFESGSPKMLENMNKKSTVEQNTQCIRTAHEHGLKVKALMSIGHPGESEHTIQETKDWLLRTKPDDFDISTITVYPGTPYYDKAVETSPGIWTYTSKNGDVLHSEDIDYLKTEDYYKGSPGEYVSHVHTDNLSTEQMVKLRDSLENDVRTDLKIPFNTATKTYEHSMGQIPGSILKSTKMPIGKGTKIWYPEHSNIAKDFECGENCRIHSHVWIGDGVKVGNNCRIQAFCYLPTGVTLEDNVFLGPRVTFTNDKYPPSDTWTNTLVKQGASIGAGATILPGLTIGADSRVGAGAVVTKDVPDGVTVCGCPAAVHNKNK